VALNIVARNHAHAMMHFTNSGKRTEKPESLSFLQKAKVLLVGVNIPRPHGQSTPADVGLDFKTIRIEGRNGVQLGGWYCPNGRNDAVVLLFHGYSADKSAMLGEAAAFHAMGLPVLLVDFRGSGASSESYTSVGFHEADDVTTAVLYARSNLPQSRILLFGQSMGGVAILRAIHNHSVKPDAVIVEAVFDTMLNTVRHRFQAMGIPSFPGAQLLVFWGGWQIGFDGFRHNPVEYARSVSCPILFLHGTDDPRARIGEGRRVYAATPAPKWFKAFPDAGHESYVSRHPQQWKDAVQEFLKAPENQAFNDHVAQRDGAISPKRRAQPFDMLKALSKPAVSEVGQAATDQGDYVVLLHGMGRTTRAMKKIEKELSQKGFRVVNVAYPSTREPIETLASNYLGQAITTQCRQPDRNIHFVTHSLGGIVLAYYLKNTALPNLGRVVMLCPPNQGSEVADRFRTNFLYRFFVGPAGQQLGTTPSGLPNNLGAVNFELGIIAGDRTLNPFTSMLIPGADDGKVAVARTKVIGMKDFLVVHRTHTFIMRNREVINQALFFINNGFFKREIVNNPRAEYALIHPVANLAAPLRRRHSTGQEYLTKE